jgi:hypothetical protein
MLKARSINTLIACCYSSPISQPQQAPRRQAQFQSRQQSQGQSSPAQKQDKKVSCTHYHKRNHTSAECHLRQCQDELGGLVSQQPYEPQISVISNFNANKLYQVKQFSKLDLDISCEDIGKDSQHSEEVNLVANFIDDTTDSLWEVHYGASSHYSNYKEHFDSIHLQLLPTNATTAKDSHKPVARTSTMAFCEYSSSCVLYVPAIKSNLLFVGSLAD